MWVVVRVVGVVGIVGISGVVVGHVSFNKIYTKSNINLLK